MGASMTKCYEIRSGRRVVAVQESVSPRQAALDYVRSLGTQADEIITLGVDTVAWRGARFTASVATQRGERADNRLPRQQ